MRPGPTFSLGVLAALLALFLLPSTSQATEEYARRTGKPCGVCHVEGSGGGELTPEGEAFRAQARSLGTAAPPGAGRQAVRFVAGYVHLVTAVLWFGTILYVHLLLKPAYAAKGLPRGELLVGWISIVVMAVTGVILTVLRIPTWEAFFRTRFGILLAVKIGLYLVMVATAVLVTFVIGPRLKGRQRGIDPEKKDLSIDELSLCDGTGGKPAYFAYKGRIYDASGSRLWKGGSHVGRHRAGFDLTEALKQAPHGEDKVFSLPAVGRFLETPGRRERPLHERGFYFMTYLNLVLVGGILLTIALWRWW
jgi:predicted heme/steroid binding protein